ncbi:MAG: AAA family ATPase, partial [Endozoicomonas sp.]
MMIAVLNQKGGGGKTTIATCLAHAFELDAPGSTLLIDQDPQGSALDWNEINEGKYVPVLGMARETLPVDIKTVGNQYQTIVIDGAPAADKLAVAA